MEGMTRGSNPSCFILMVFYLGALLGTATSSEFFMFWLYMELSMILLMGVSFSVCGGSMGPFLVYFLMQGYAAFSWALGYGMGFSEIISISLMLKLGLFPFHSWFPMLVAKLPNALFVLVATSHKVPPFMGFVSFSGPSPLLTACAVATMVASAVMCLASKDMWFLIACSSVGNNVWLIFMAQVSLSLFVAYLILYSVVLAFTISQVRPFTSGASSFPFSLVIGLASLAGLPPFPLFYLKVLAFLSISATSWGSTLPLIVASSWMSLGYLCLATKSLVPSGMSSLEV